MAKYLSDYRALGETAAWAATSDNLRTAIDTPMNQLRSETPQSGTRSLINLVHRRIFGQLNRHNLQLAWLLTDLWNANRRLSRD